MLTCKEVSTAIASDRLKRAGWWYRLQAGLHLLLCGHCRAYRAQIRAIGAAARQLLGDPQADPEALASLEEAILGLSTIHWMGPR